MYTSRYVYNQSKNWIDLHKNYNFYEIRNTLVTKTSKECSNCKKKSKGSECKECKIPCEIKVNNNIQDWELETPKHIRLSSVNEIVSNYKSAFTNLKHGNISSFTLDYKRKKSKRMSIELEQSGITWKDNQFFIYPTYLPTGIPVGKRTLRRKELKIEKDSRLLFQNNKFYLILPQTYPRQETENLERICSLDPGSSTFMVGYDPNGKIFKFHSLAERRNYYRKKIAILQENKKYKKIQHYQDKIRNIVDDLHWKSIHYLLSHYDTILLPHFDSQKMVKGSRRRGLNRNLNDLSHYQFKQRLLDKAKTMTHKVVILTTEDYTTKTCGQCGKIKEMKLGDRIFDCENCSLSICRDTNASRNILLKYIQKYHKNPTLCV